MNIDDYSVVFDNVSVIIEGFLVLKDISFKLPRGKFLTIIGPNGAGKTTLLRTMLGLIDPSSGRIFVEGLNILDNANVARNLIGYVPQRENVVRNMPIRVWDTVLMSRKARKGVLSILDRRDYKAVKNALELVGMWELRFKRFSSLSGGQQQRTLIARALALEPKILLFDEALSGVDATSTEIILDALSNVKKKGVTIIYVTHDLNEVIELTDFAMVLKNKIIAYGELRSVLREDVLREAYGKNVKVIWKGDECFAILGDKHA